MYSFLEETKSVNFYENALVFFFEKYLRNSSPNDKNLVKW